MSLKTWLRSWWHEDVQPLISEAEAIESAKRHAEENHLSFRQPVYVRVERQWINASNEEEGRRAVYILGLGGRRPMLTVEVDAADGTILAITSSHPL